MAGTNRLKCEVAARYARGLAAHCYKPARQRRVFHWHSALALRTRPPLSPSALALNHPPTHPACWRLRPRPPPLPSALALRTRPSNRSLRSRLGYANQNDTPPMQTGSCIDVRVCGGSPAPAPPRPTASASGRRLRPRGHPLRNDRRAPVA